jgi:hypothetical protein
VRDSVPNSFLAKTGGNLYIQGAQGIDILALNHPETPFQSGSNLTLASDGIISGDAHFNSGGNFSILNLSGTGGNFVSLYDPIFTSANDVALGNSYTGAALKVQAGGSITGGNITVTRPDTATNIPSTDPDFVTLTTTPALIMNAGTTINVGNINTAGKGQDTAGPVRLSAIRKHYHGDIDTSERSEVR